MDGKIFGDPVLTPLPLKQGLKPIRTNYPIILTTISLNASSIKTRIETSLARQSRVFGIRLNASSIKTRIETTQKKEIRDSAYRS